MSSASTDYRSALCAGAAAGLSVDLIMFPIDTIKTRLQSADGFVRSGGFKRIYAGLGSTAVGSMPGAALFFCTYEGVKRAATASVLPKTSTSGSKTSTSGQNMGTSGHTPSASEEAHMALVHMGAASCGEVMACLVRVPTEVVKQRAQTNKDLSSRTVLMQTIRTEGFAGLYRGYVSTVMREIPFSLIQFPLWEYLKRHWSQRQNRPVEAWQSGLCGALAGGFSAGITTPLDVAKTRIMLAEKGSPLARGSIVHAVNVVFRDKGVAGLFAGVVPRVTWISIGGCVFLGVYDKVRSLLLGS